MRLHFLIVLIVIGVVPSNPAAASCPLARVDDESLSRPFRGRGVRVSSSPPMVMFRSGLERDDDGAPTTYHRGLVDGGPDPGLDHICAGGSVLEHRGGRLVDRYGAGGSIGSLSGIDPATGTGRSKLCKRDYIALRDAGFPACGPDQPCMLWYGVLSEPRRCGFPSTFGSADDRRCGLPIRQRAADGTETDFYVTTTALTRRGAPGNSRVQSDYVDASTVPYIVMPGGQALPNGQVSRPGDVALVAWRGRSVFAVVGDSGPRMKLGEGSRAVLRALQGGSIATIAADDPATTLLFPGSRDRILTHWPLDPVRIDAEGRALVNESGGAAALRACPGLGDLS